MRKFFQVLTAVALLGGALGVSAQTGARAAAHPHDMMTFPRKDVPGASAKVAALNEGFDNVAGLGAAGWFMQNNSSPLGTIPAWFQGTATNAPTPGPFNAYDGATNAYIAANYNNVSGPTPSATGCSRRCWISAMLPR